MYNWPWTSRDTSPAGWTRIRLTQIPQDASISDAQTSEWAFIRTNIGVQPFHARHQFPLLVKSVYAIQSHFKNTSSIIRCLNRILDSLTANDNKMHLQFWVDINFVRWRNIRSVPLTLRVKSTFLASGTLGKTGLGSKTSLHTWEGGHLRATAPARLHRFTEGIFQTTARASYSLSAPRAHSHITSETGQKCWTNRTHIRCQSPIRTKRAHHSHMTRQFLLRNDTQERRELDRKRTQGWKIQCWNGQPHDTRQRKVGQVPRIHLNPSASHSIETP